MQRNENRIRDSLSAHKAGRTAWSKLYGLNAYWTGKHWSQRKKDAEYWHYLVRAELRRQGVKPRVFKHPVYITFYHNDGLDIDNHAAVGKMVVDALKGVLIADDDRKHFAGVRASVLGRQRYPCGD